MDNPTAFLYDVDTDRLLGPATPEQIAAAATHPDGWIALDMCRRPITLEPWEEDFPHHTAYVYHPKGH